MHVLKACILDLWIAEADISCSRTTEQGNLGYDSVAADAPGPQCMNIIQQHHECHRMVFT